MNSSVGIEKDIFGVDLFGESMAPIPNGPLSEKFIFPPFSVLDARGGEWQNRKRAWFSLGIKSEIGREIDPTCVSKNVPDYMAGRGNNEGGSIFDPVLSELCYSWFCPRGGQIVDPFAGGSVRGIVAAKMGYKYWGCDLRREQIEANNIQADEICKENKPEWICGDSMDMIEKAPGADFIFSCPPYGDLETYSDDPKDLSNMEYHTFIPALKRIILRCCLKLKRGGMACFVVGDFRDKKSGNYRGFVVDVINGFRECG